MNFKQSKSLKVVFSYADRKLNYPHKTQLKNFIELLFKKEKKELNNITYIFCSDEFLLNINQQFLNHDYYTDIITFSYSSKNEPIEAEAYISIDRVKDNAKQLGTTFFTEIERVVFHGALHLCGYKDKQQKDILLMRKAENKYLAQYRKTTNP